MKARILSVVSALAIMVAVTAYAEANSGTSIGAGANADINAQATTGEEFKQGLENAKDGLVETTKGVGETAKNAYEDIKVKVFNNGQSTDASFNTRMTAEGMLGEPIYNHRNEKIGTVTDIILDKQGNAALVVVSDGGFMGIGDKLAAFDYNLVVRQEANGDVIMPLTDDIVSKVAAFSYDAKEKSDKVQVIPDNGLSVAEILKGKLIDAKGNAAGDIENITFRQGQADQVIVKLDKAFMIDTEKTAISFDNLEIEHAGETALNLRMSEQQSAQFDLHRKTTTN